VIADATGGSTAVGAILGAAVGGAAGAAIGRRMDRQAEELEDELPGAEVERVGEGIQVTFDSGILFDFDSDALRSEARANLADLAASLSEYDGTRVLVVGHTDSRGTDEYNQGLSERRAGAARTYLMSQGISPDRIEAVGRGETEPVDSNDSDAGRQANRRVEVAIFASEEMQEEMRSTHGGGR
jgi:outer membrane protein OmpA-like peptidoglycan-associated protein